MHWLCPKLELCRAEHRGAGVFARAPLTAGELLTMWGGELFTGAQLATAAPALRIHAIQVHDDLYLVPHGHLEGADYFNHCCDPNAGLQGQIGLVALRDIAAGEQVCFDYAMSDSSDYDEFECRCGAPSCRGRVTGADWRLPHLRRRYRGYFSPYLQQRIEAEGASVSEGGIDGGIGSGLSVRRPGPSSP